ncbi:vinculin A [Pelomyxa schiedti]|nr:vinculin A [Pelomyxa schiedti]
MEQILEAIADNVSNLMMAASKAGGGVVFGNMVPAAQLIKNTVDGICTAATESPALLSVPEIKSRMAEEAAELRGATQSLLTCTSKARDCTGSAQQEAQQGAITAAKTVLQRVVNLVLTEDYYNILQFVEVAKCSAEASKKLSTANTLQHLVPHVSACNDQHIELIKAMASRKALTQSSSYQATFDECIEDLKVAEPKHIECVHAAINNPSTDSTAAAENALQGVITVIDRVIYLVKDIAASNQNFIEGAMADRPITTVREDDLEKKVSEFVTSLGSVVPAIRSHDHTAAAKEVVLHANQVAAALRAVADECTDPTRKALIEASLPQIQQKTAKVLAAMKNVVEHPNDPAAAKELEDVLQNLKQTLRAVTAFATGSLTDIAAVTGVSALEVMQDLKKSIEITDGASAQRAQGILATGLEAHIAAARALLETTTDPVHRAQIEEAIHKLENIKPKLLVAAQYAIDHPNDMEARPVLDNLINQARQAIMVISGPSKVADAHFNGRAIEELDEIIASLQRDDKNTERDCVAHAKKYAAALQAQIAVANEALANVTDPRRRELIQSAIVEEQATLGKILELTKVCLADPRNTAKLVQLQEMVATAKQSSNKLVTLLKPTAEETAASREKEKNRLRETQEREQAAAQHAAQQAALQVHHTTAAHTGERVSTPIIVEGPKQPQIFAAALKLDGDIPAAPNNSSSESGTPQGKLLTSSHGIAQVMAKLSALSVSGDIQGMITASKQISTMVADVITQANKIADTCNDPRVKADCLTFSQACQNFGIQLKIMSAVKAASKENDPTAEDQLIAAATGLSNMVIKTVKACETAQLLASHPKGTTSKSKPATTSTNQRRS